MSGKKLIERSRQNSDLRSKLDEGIDGPYADTNKAVVVAQSTFKKAKEQ